VSSFVAQGHISFIHQLNIFRNRQGTSSPSYSHVKGISENVTLSLQLNMSEFAGGRGGVQGWSSRIGQTTNAYYPNASACGSSSGSGVATSIGLATITLGTETDGSITCPSSMNNIVGIKPTLGLTSRAGSEVITFSLYFSVLSPGQSYHFASAKIQ
jgi:hypothetical protein